MSVKTAGHKLARSVAWIALPVMCLSMASCATTQKMESKKTAHGKEYFSEKEYGVKASPRVADGKIPQGGGRYMVGNPYQVKGKTYVPKEDPGYNKSGLASWYGSAFHGRLTANGEVYDQLHLSAAHPTFPLPSYARVTNIDTGSSVIVRVNDRGPFHPGRIIDVSNKAAELLDFKNTGTGHVNVKYIGKAPLEGHDMPYLMASYVRKGDRLPQVAPEGQIATGVMVASNEPVRTQLRSYESANGSLQTSLAGPTPTSGRSSKTSAFALMAASSAAAEASEAESFSHLPPAGPLPPTRPYATTVADVAPAAPRAAAMQQPAKAAPRPAAPSIKAQAAPTAQPHNKSVALVWTTGAMPANR